MQHNIRPHTDQALHASVSLNNNTSVDNKSLKEVTVLLPAVQFCACFVSCEVLTWNDGLRTQYTEHQRLRVCTHSLPTASGARDVYRQLSVCNMIPEIKCPQ